MRHTWEQMGNVELLTMGFSDLIRLLAFIVQNYPWYPCTMWNYVKLKPIFDSLGVTENIIYTTF